MHFIFIFLKKRQQYTVINIKYIFFIFLINSFNYLINLYEICNKNCAEVSYKQTYFGWLCDVDECWNIVVILLNITRDDEKSWFSTLALQNRYVWFQNKINNNNDIRVSTKKLHVLIKCVKWKSGLFFF